MITITRSDLRRVVVAIDPAVTHGEESDDTGIIVVARGPHQPSTCKLVERTGHCPGHGYVLDDRTCHVAPHVWAAKAVQAFDDWAADLVVAEVNNGADMVGETVRAVRSSIPYRSVRATRGKQLRAEPVAALYEQGRVHHIGTFSDLEAQMTTWTPDSDSPDRMDALVWAMTALDLVAAQGAAFMSMWRRQIEDPKPRRGHNRPQLRVLTGGLCDHRWRGDGCVFCGERRQAV